jgi:hypothetical protein
MDQPHLSGNLQAEVSNTARQHPCPQSPAFDLPNLASRETALSHADPDYSEQSTAAN